MIAIVNGHGMMGNNVVSSAGISANRRLYRIAVLGVLN
jgi:hypothetical protein